MWWGFVVLLLIALVLQRTWDYLYDRQFTWTGLALLLAIFALWVGVLLVDGFLWLVPAVLGTFAAGALLDVVLEPLLARILRNRAEVYSRKERARFAAALENASSEDFYESMEDEHLENARECQMTLLMASIEADVERALAAHDKHTEDLATFYFDRNLRDLPPWHRGRAVRNPRTIDYYFRTAVDLLPAKPSQALRTWIMERPAGARCAPERAGLGYCSVRAPGPVAYVMVIVPVLRSTDQFPVAVPVMGPCVSQTGCSRPSASAFSGYRSTSPPQRETTTTDSPGSNPSPNTA